MKKQSNTMYISEFFRRLMKNTRTNYEEMAEKLGLENKQNVSYMINHLGDGFWTYENLKLWSAVLGTTIEKATADYNESKVRHS